MRLRRRPRAPPDRPVVPAHDQQRLFAPLPVTASQVADLDGRRPVGTGSTAVGDGFQVPRVHEPCFTGRCALALVVQLARGRDFHASAESDDGRVRGDLFEAHLMVNLFHLFSFLVARATWKSMTTARTAASITGARRTHRSRGRIPTAPGGHRPCGRVHVGWPSVRPPPSSGIPAGSRRRCSRRP